MESYNTTPIGNQHADLMLGVYVNFAIDNINEIAEMYKTFNKPYHVMLIHIEILLLLCETYDDERMYVKNKIDPDLPEWAKSDDPHKIDLEDWKDSFYGWFERCKKQIPSKYHQDIESSANELFLKLENL
jgi:hypothetical protein